MLPILEQLHTQSHVHYVTEDPAKVHCFLTHHPHVEQLLQDAKASLQHTFGKGVTVSLTVTSNPELTDGEFVVARIHSSLSVTKAKARLDAFDETWWLDHILHAKGQLIFTVAFA